MYLGFNTNSHNLEQNSQKKQSKRNFIVSLITDTWILLTIKKSILRYTVQNTSNQIRAKLARLKE